MNEEQRAAAEGLLREIIALMETNPSSRVNIGKDRLARLIELASAYLAEHPADDGEPVTEERLASCGFRVWEDGWRRTIHRDPPNTIFGGEYDLFIKIEQKTACLINVIGGKIVNQAVLPIEVSTMADVRRAALGVPLTEGTTP